MTNLHEKLLTVKPAKEILFGKKYQTDLKKFADIFEINIQQARTLLCLTNYYFRNENDVCSLHSFTKDIGLTDQEYLLLLNTINILMDKSLIKNTSGYDRSRKYKFYPEIEISDDVRCFLLTGKRDIVNIDYSDLNSIFDHLNELFKDYEDSRDSQKLAKELAQIVEKLDSSNFKTVISGLTTDNAMIFLYILTEYLKGDTVSLNRCVDIFYQRISRRTATRAELISERSELIKKKLLKLEETTDVFMDDTVNLCLTDSAKELIEETPLLSSTPPSGITMLKHDDIRTQLIFDKDLKEHIDMLQTALAEDRLQYLQQTLHEKNLPSGFVCLLYGEPGTGKTATVHETARKTGRNILQVDIASVRNKWVGESEKNLKNIFTYYHTAKKHFAQLPILLFNEADALIGKRIDVSSSVDQMNNSMQNILLEELERFDGIFFATTNLIDNIDDAFSRRFLYKINYKIPSQELREKIWNLKLPELDNSMIQKLSSYPLSGGQIENVAHKATVHSILYNKTLTDSDFISLINDEISFKSKKCIGF